MADACGRHANQSVIAVNNLSNRLCSLAFRLRTGALYRAINQQRLLIVMYHGVVPDERSRQHWTQLPLSQFCWQMDYLAQALRTYFVVRGGQAIVVGQVAVITSGRCDL